MAYGDRSPRERLAGALGSATAMALLGAGLLLGLATRQVVRAPDTATPLLDIPLTPPPPRPREVVPTRRAPAKEAPAPPDLRNKATSVVVPPPILRPPVPPPPILAAPKADIGMAAQSGASDRAGPGTGAGGRGNGSGGGGDGDGDGYTAPEQLNGLKYSYLAPELRARSAQGDAEVRFHVTEQGRVSSCRILTSSGDAGLDAGICQAVQQHLRFRPSRDPDGNPVGADVIAWHGWVIDRSGYDR